MAGMSLVEFQKRFPKYSKNAYKAYRKNPELEKVFAEHPNNGVLRVVKASKDVVTRAKKELSNQIGTVKTVWYDYEYEYKSTEIKNGVEKVSGRQKETSIVYMEFTPCENVPVISQIVMYIIDKEENIDMTKLELSIVKGFFERIIINGLYGQYYTYGKPFVGSNMIMETSLLEFDKKNTYLDYCFGFMSDLESVMYGVEVGKPITNFTVCISSCTENKVGYATVDLFDSSKSKVRLLSNGVEVYPSSKEYDDLRYWFFKEMENALI